MLGGSKKTESWVGRWGGGLEDCISGVSRYTCRSPDRDLLNAECA